MPQLTPQAARRSWIDRPATPATEVFPEEDVDLLHDLLEAQGHRNVERMEPGRPPASREVVVDLRHLFGFHPWKRQKLPGAKKVWLGLERLNWAVQVRDAIGARRRE